ncbi:MAG: shikimate dehydrogenase [Armatimonadota bacterium]|nr:shikimate dehydrogenase [Armatimonadota bacterium]
MTPFAFIVHPIDARRDVARKYPLAKYVPESAVEWFLKHKRPMVLSEIKGVRSVDGKETSGWFIGCPLTPKMMLELPLELVYDRIVECCVMAEKLGARIIGLGAFTAVVGDGGITIAKRSPIAVTTGNSYTVATAIDGTLEAAQLMDIEPSVSTLAVVGATGSIGRTCAQVLAPSFVRTILIGRDKARTEEAAALVGHGAEVSTGVAAISSADVVITVTSAEGEVIQPEHLKIGAVVCDVARPRDVSIRVSKERDDVLVIEGGVVAVPGDVDFGMSFGFPEKTAYACMSETMMLALENRPESFTLGKDVTVEQVQETRDMAKKLGFCLAGFRSFEKAVSPETIERVKKAANRKRALTASPHPSVTPQTP